MKSRRRARVIMFTLSVAAVAVGTYLLIVPAILTRQYIESVHAAAQPLETTFQDLRKSTDLPILTDSNAPLAVKKENADQINRHIADAREEIDTLRQESQVYQPPRYLTFIGLHKNAQVLYERIQRLVEQSESTLDGYADLVTYTEGYTKATDKVVFELDKFNSVDDINIYAGESENVKQVAGIVRTEAALLAGFNYPGGMVSLNTATVKALNEAAVGFDDLAKGLAVPADEPIYAAARDIEAATRQMEVARGELYVASIQGSRAVRNVHDLLEKLELVLTVQSH